MKKEFHKCANNFLKKLFFSVILVMSSCNFYAQTIKGKIIDSDNKQAVPFAIIVMEGTNKGITADLDGNFELTINSEVKNIVIQVIGYTKKTISVSELDNSKINIIKLKSNSVTLLEIVIKSSENPAIPIIKKVIKNKPIFNIENLPYYFCTTYAKTYFTMSDKTGNEDFYKTDSSNKTNKMLAKNYLFFMESVTEKKYKYKNISQEKVTASRVSGFKSSPFGAFASQLQSFTFYSDNIALLGLKYINPLSKGTFKRYNFEIMDTLINYLDTTITIKFYPKKNSNFKALKGILYINKNQYVLANVLAEPSEIPSDGNGIRIQQLYEKVDSTHWFPKQVNTEIYFYGFTINGDKDNSKKGSIIKGVSRLYIKDIKLDSVIKIKHKSVSVYNEEGSDKKDEAYWKKNRIDSLTKKEKSTYEVIDSVGKEINLDKKLKWFNTLTTGKFQIGYLNFDLKHIIRANDYEGVRLGLGLSSSNKLSRWYSFGGYGGYGFKDKAFKYGGFAQINLNWQQSTFLLAEAANEVVETAGTYFLNESQNLINTEQIRNILISKMDKVNYGKASFNTSIFNFIRLSAYYKVEQRQSPFGYALAHDNLLFNEKTNFTLNEAGIQFKIWPKEKFAETMGQLISLGSKWPKFSLNIIKGLNITNFGYTGDFDYTKLDLKIDHQLNFKIKGFISYQLQASKVFGNVPYSLQYNNKGSRSDNYWLSAEKTFETMYLNEFISTQYAAFFFAINSGKILKPNKHCNPEFELIHNYGIGSLNNRNNLTNIELNDISKGYTETGLRIKNIINSNFSSFGAGIYYRYGNYAYEDMSKNLAYKFVFSVSF